MSLRAELLIGCEEDRTLRAVLIGMLRGKEARHPGAVVEPAPHGEPAVLRRKSPTVRHIGRDRLAMLDRW
jgi:hypothetical protein